MQCSEASRRSWRNATHTLKFDISVVSSSSSWIDVHCRGFRPSLSAIALEKSNNSQQGEIDLCVDSVKAQSQRSQAAMRSSSAVNSMFAANRGCLQLCACLLACVGREREGVSSEANAQLVPASDTLVTSTSTMMPSTTGRGNLFGTRFQYADGKKWPGRVLDVRPICCDRGKGPILASSEVCHVSFPPTKTHRETQTFG